MEIELPLTQAGSVLGWIDMKTGEIKVNEANPVTYSCSLSGDCCTRFHIPVTDFDIERIEKHGFELDQIIESASPTVKFPKTSSGSIEKNYQIKRNPFTGACTFLEENKCKIHAFKPFGCRIFPFQFLFFPEEMVKVVVHDSNFCPSVRSGTKEKARNQEYLQFLRDQLSLEIARRELYFDVYGDQM